MTVYTTPDPVYPDEDEYIADGDSFFTGDKELVWSEALGYYVPQAQPTVIKVGP